MSESIESFEVKIHARSNCTRTFECDELSALTLNKDVGAPLAVHQFAPDPIQVPWMEGRLVMSIDHIQLLLIDTGDVSLMWRRTNIVGRPLYRPWFKIIPLVNGIETTPVKMIELSDTDQCGMIHFETRLGKFEAGLFRDINGVSLIVPGQVWDMC